jgi:hypothetical protein
VEGSDAGRDGSRWSRDAASAGDKGAQKRVDWVTGVVEALRHSKSDQGNLAVTLLAIQHALGLALDAWDAAERGFLPCKSCGLEKA